MTTVSTGPTQEKCVSRSGRDVQSASNPRTMTLRSRRRCSASNASRAFRSASASYASRACRSFSISADAASARRYWASSSSSSWSFRRRARAALQSAGARAPFPAALRAALQSAVHALRFGRLLFASPPPPPPSPAAPPPRRACRAGARASAAAAPAPPLAAAAFGGLASRACSAARARPGGGPRRASRARAAPPRPLAARRRLRLAPAPFNANTPRASCSAFSRATVSRCAFSAAAWRSRAPVPSARASLVGAPQSRAPPRFALLARHLVPAAPPPSASVAAAAASASSCARTAASARSSARVPPASGASWLQARCIRAASVGLRARQSLGSAIARAPSRRRRARLRARARARGSARPLRSPPPNGGDRRCRARLGHRRAVGGPTRRVPRCSKRRKRV